MYNFFLAKGDKLIDLKPKRENYERAYVRKAEQIIPNIKNKSFKEFKAENTDEFKKIVFLSIKKMALVRGNDGLETELNFMLHDTVCEMIGCLTPRELMQMFPITKTYDGEKYQAKDYFFTMEMIDKHGLDNEIGTATDAVHFMFDYVNATIDVFLVNCITAMEALHVENGGKTFFEEMGIESYHIENGEMVSDWTGESVGKVAPRKLNNYMSID